MVPIERLRQEDCHDFKASCGYRARPCFKEKGRNCKKQSKSKSSRRKEIENSEIENRNAKKGQVNEKVQ